MAQNKRHRVLALAALVVFTDMLGYGMVIPILPLYGAKLGASAGQIGVLFASYSFVFLVALFPLCSLVDRYGKKRLIVLGMTLLSITSVLYAVSTSLLLLTLSRMLQGLAATLTWAAALPLASAHTSAEKRGLELSAISAASGLGSIIGPLIGGSGGFHTPFYFLALWSLVMAILCVAYVKEPIASRSHKEYERLRGKILALLAHKEVQCSCLGVAFCWFFWGMLEVLFPLYLEECQYSPFMTGVLFGVAGGAFVLTQPAAGMIADRTGRTVPVVLGLTALALFSPVVVHLVKLPQLLLTMALLGVVSALVYVPTLSLIGDRVSPEDQGIGYGLNTWMFSISYLVGPWLGGIVADLTTLQVPFYGCSVVVLAGSIWIARIGRELTQ